METVQKLQQSLFPEKKRKEMQEVNQIKSDRNDYCNIYASKTKNYR